MSRKDQVQIFLDSAIGELGAVLSSRGFKSDPFEDRLLEVVKFYWHRPSSWKFDVVTLWLRRRFPQGLHCSLEVFLSVEKLLGREGERSSAIDSMVDGLAIQGILSGNKSYYFPNFFGKLLPGRAPSFARRVGRDVKRALPWFENYATPEQCIERLRAGQTNWGTAEVPIQRLEDKLLKVIDERDSAHKPG